VTVREPKRGGFDPPGASEQKSGFFSTLRMFFSRPSLVLVAFGGGATQFVTYGVGNFTTLFLMREKGMTLDQVAVYYALVVAVAMSGGNALSGWAVAFFPRRSKQALSGLPARPAGVAVSL